MAYRKGKWGGLEALAAVLCLVFTPASAAPATTAAPVTRATEPRPALWLLADDDTRIYLFGTIHILPPDLRWRSAELDRVVAAADELVLEIAEDPTVEERAGLGALMGLGKSVPIAQRVSPERRAGLEAMIGESGLPIETFDSMQTWAVAVALSAMASA